MKAYRLKAKDVPWGDYGRILVHGMSSHLERIDGAIQLERTGPFLPPITFPAGDVLLSEDAKRAVEVSGLVGLTFRSVRKAKMVRLEWHEWNRASAKPREYPK